MHPIDNTPYFHHYCYSRNQRRARLESSTSESRPGLRSKAGCISAPQPSRGQPKTHWTPRPRLRAPARPPETKARDFRRGLIHRRSGFKTVNMCCLNQHGTQHCCNADATCNNMCFESTPFETTPYASPQKLRAAGPLAETPRARTLSAPTLARHACSRTARLERQRALLLLVVVVVVAVVIIIQ